MNRVPYETYIWAVFGKFSKLRCSCSGKPGTAATLALMGENAVTGGVGRAGVTVSGGATISITNGVSVAAQGMGSLSATGGAGAAGIGGDDNAQTGTIRIQGGAITATGGASGAGIGGGSYTAWQDCRIEISGGLVTATAGEGAYAIGAGVRDGESGFYFGGVRITGGTVFPVRNGGLAVGSSSYGSNAMDILGGAVFTERWAVSPIAQSYGREVKLAYPVDFDVGSPDTPVDATIPIKDGDSTVEYGMNDVRSDSRGIIRLWLPEGNRIVSVGGEYWRVSISGDGTTVERWNSRLTVNGVGVSERSGGGWTFDFATMTVHLTNAGPFTILGEEPGTSVSVESSCYIVLTNVTLATGVPNIAALDFAAGVSATLELAGTNSLAGGRYAAGLSIAETASLVIRGNGFLSATGGEYGAGIGNAWASSSGDLAIEGGTIVAQGGWLGAGIGGGSAND